MRTTGIEALDTIVSHKRRTLREAMALRPISELQRIADSATEPRDMYSALAGRVKAGRLAVIAEIKRRSPSAGWIHPRYSPPTESLRDAHTVSPEFDPFDPALFAAEYERAGAAALSCLTDERFFGGHLSYLHRVRSSVALPVLRKDFIVDPYQVVESRAAGADAVLLIAECLDDQILESSASLSFELGMTTLIEVHTESNLNRVLRLFPDRPARRVLLGINNRDLSAMTTDVRHAIRLRATVDTPGVLVAESGIRTADDIRTLRDAGIHAVLIGESLMRTESPGEALRSLLEGSAA